MFSAINQPGSKRLNLSGGGRFSPPQRGAAFTLVEMLVATVCGILIMTAVVVVFIFSNRSFTAMGNYMDLDKQSRNAIDQMSREIRQCAELTSYASNRVEFLDISNNVLSYTWDKSSGLLTRSWNGTTNVLLRQCDYLCFNIFQRNPISNQFNFYTASNMASITKLVDVSWICSRTLLGNKANTESIQTAKIVMRN